MNRLKIQTDEYNSSLKEVYKQIDEINDGFIFYEIIGGSNTFDYSDIIFFFTFSSIDEFINFFERHHYEHSTDWSDEYQFDTDSYVELFTPMIEAIIKFQSKKVEYERFLRKNGYMDTNLAITIGFDEPVTIKS